MTYTHDRQRVIYVFSEINTYNKCICIITQYKLKLVYTAEKQKLNIKVNDKRIVMKNATPTLKAYGTILGGVDFYRGYDDENLSIIKGVGKNGLW